MLAWIASVNKLLVKQMQQLGIPEKNVLKLKIPGRVLIRTILYVCSSVPFVCFSKRTCTLISCLLY